MFRPLVCTVLALSAGFPAASAAEMSSPQTYQRQETAAPTAAPSKGQPDVVQWMGHAIDDILSGKVPAEGRSSAGGK